MSDRKKLKQQGIANETAVQKRSRKAPGTRAGTLLDWREGALGGGVSRRLSDSVRDGR